MQLTAEHIALQDTVKQFIARQITPNIAAWEKAGIFPAHELFREMGKMGTQGVSMGIAVQTDMATPALARFGSEQLCQEFLVPAIAGEQVVSIGVSEAGAGSDVASVKTRARKDGDDYLISGSKMWITNGTQADWVCLLVNTSDDPPHRNKSLICVPLMQGGRRVPGVSVQRIEKIGMWSSDTAQIFFDEVRVPQRYRIGEEGLGFGYQMMQFQEERLSAAARRITALTNVIDETIDYTRSRIAFGRPVLDNQVVHFRLAELKTEIECLRLLVYRATDVHMGGEDMTALASMAKLKVGRLCREVTDSCLQYWGGMGFTLDNSVSRAFRDLRLISIGGGADEVMLQIICKRMGILPRR